MSSVRRSRLVSVSGALAVGLGVALVVGSLGVGVGEVSAASAAAAAVPAAPIGAHRAPGDQISVSLPALLPDFGYVKQGTVVNRTIDVLNDGVDNIRIDPAPLSALTAPFALKATTIVATETIAPGQRRTITVSYTAPPAGAVSTQPITLTLVDVDRAATQPFTMNFEGRSLATDRAYFEVRTPAGTPSIEFGTVKPGAVSTVHLTLPVLGIDPLFFKDSSVVAQDQAGKPLPVVKVTGSSFGAAGKTYRPGETATLDVTFAPTADGSFPGTLRVEGQVMNGNPETPSIVVVTPFAARAVTPVGPTPTPTPTPAPTTTPSPLPSSTATPVPSTSSPAVPAAATPGAPLRGTPALAQTGSPAVAFGFAGLTVLFGGIAMTLVLRTRRRRESGTGSEQ